MPRFNAMKAFEHLRVQSKRQKEAALEACLLKQKEWTAYGQRNTALNGLMNVFPFESAGVVDVQRAAALMVEYAQTLSSEWVKARFKSVSARLAKLIKEGKPVQDAGIKKILLNLLLFANERDHARVEEIFREAIKGDPADVDRFRWCLLNWLVDKVVDTWPPGPEELRPPVKASVEKPKEEGFSDASSIVPAKGDWVPATKAVEWAEQKGYLVNIKWLTQNSSKRGVGVRKVKQPGKYKKEVELNSFALYLLKHGKLLKDASPEEEPVPETIRRSISEANEKKLRERPLN
jgi:hypothetical protein